MLRYKTKTRPGLVALYDIRPGNGAGPFLQRRSPHGACGKQRRWLIGWGLTAFSAQTGNIYVTEMLKFIENVDFGQVSDICAV